MYKILQIRSKFAKFQETSFGEKLQYLQRTANYKGATKLEGEVEIKLEALANSFFCKFEIIFSHLPPLYGIRLPYIFQISCILNLKTQYFNLGISYFESEILKYQVFHTLNLKYQVLRVKYLVFRKLGISSKQPVSRRLSRRLFLFVANVWTVTMRPSAGFKKSSN